MSAFLNTIRSWFTKPEEQWLLPPLWAIVLGYASPEEIPMLEKLRMFRPLRPTPSACIMDDAAAAGNIVVLQWGYSLGRSWNHFTCAQAAAGGHLDALVWLRAAGLWPAA